VLMHDELELNPFGEADLDDECPPEEWKPRELSQDSLTKLEQLRYVPATSCKPGDLFEISIKRGCYYIYRRVQAKTAPYEDDFGQGRKSLYVKVFAHGIPLTPVLFSKLMVKIPQLPSEEN